MSDSAVLISRSAVLVFDTDPVSQFFRLRCCDVKSPFWFPIQRCSCGSNFFPSRRPLRLKSAKLHWEDGFLVRERERQLRCWALRCFVFFFVPVLNSTSGGKHTTVPPLAFVFAQRVVRSRRSDYRKKMNPNAPTV